MTLSSHDREGRDLASESGCHGCAVGSRASRPSSHCCEQRSSGPRSTANASGSSRRGFLVAVARGAAGAALAGLGVVLALGRGGQQNKEEACLRQGVCRGCSRADDCGLPQALSLREAMKREARDG